MRKAFDRQTRLDSQPVADVRLNLNRRDESAAGSRFVETVLAIIESCRQQHRNTFDYHTGRFRRFRGHELMLVV